MDFKLSSFKEDSMDKTIDSMHGAINAWWDLTDAQQNAYSKKIPASTTTWTWSLTKHESGYWCFSEPQYGIINETLCNGTEKIIDSHYELLNGKKPILGDTLTCTISKEKLPEFTTEWYLCYNDYDWKEAHIYIDCMLHEKLWLCPLLQILFKGLPLNLWIHISE